MVNKICKKIVMPTSSSLDTYQARRRDGYIVQVQKEQLPRLAKTKPKWNVFIPNRKTKKFALKSNALSFANNYLKKNC